MVNEPPPDADPKRAFKYLPRKLNNRYPFLANELLSYTEEETPHFINLLLSSTPSTKEAEEKKPLLEKLMSLLAQTEDLNVVLAGYFDQIVTTLLHARRVDMLRYFLGHPVYLDGMLRHSYNESVASVLQSALVSQRGETLPPELGTRFEKESRRVIREIINRIAPGKRVEEITNNCFALLHCVQSQEHAEFLLSEPVLRDMFAAVKSGHPLCLRAGLTFFMMINMSLAATESVSTSSDMTEETKRMLALGKKMRSMDLSPLRKLEAESLPYFRSYMLLPGDVVLRGTILDHREFCGHSKG